MTCRKLLGAFALLCLSGYCLAQANLTGTIVGTVTDSEGVGLPGVTINFQSESLIQARSVVSTESGQYRAPLLPAGQYTLTFVFTGFKTAKRNAPLGLGQTARIDVQMEVGTLAETLVVTSTDTGIEDVTITTNLRHEEVDKLPLANRDLNSLAYNAPAVAVTYNNDIQIAGANTYETTFMLNGADISDNYFGSPTLVYIEEAIEETQVLTSGISARYGRFTGGLVNAITKSGGNTFEGSLRAQLANDSWNATNPFNRGSETTDDVRQEYQATLGGPIIKDHLWFFVAAHQEPDQTSQITLGGYDWASGNTLDQPSSEDRYEVKLTWGMTPDHVVSASVLDFESSVGPPLIGLPAADPKFANAGAVTTERSAFTLNYKGALTSNLFLDAQYTTKESISAIGGDPNNGHPVIYLNTQTFFNNHWWDSTDKGERNNETLSANLNFFADTPVGTHNLNVGLQSVTGITAGENRQSPTGINLFIINYKPEPLGGSPFDGFLYTFPGSGIEDGRTQRWVAIPLTEDGSRAEAQMKQHSLYLDDEWTVNDHWRINLGARFEDFNGEGPRVTDVVDFNDISPRLGVSYDLHGDGSFKVNATMGKYVGKFHETVSNRGTGIGTAPVVIQVYTGPDVVTTNPDDPTLEIHNEANWQTISVRDARVASRVAEDAKSPYSNEFTLGMRKRTGSGNFSITYIQREYKRLYDDFVGEIGTVEFDGTTLDITEWGNVADAERKYRGLVVTADQRGENWFYGGNVTWSELEGNYVGQDINRPALGTQWGNNPRAIPIELAEPYGRLRGDVPLRARVWGNYTFDFKGLGALDVGGMFRYESGDVYNHTVRVPLPEGYQHPYNSALFDFTHPAGGRGQYRFPTNYTFDLSINYELTFARHYTWYFKGIVNNVFNHILQTGYDTTTSLVPGTGVLNYEGDTVTDFAVAPQAQLGPNYGKATNALHYSGVRTIQLISGFRF